MYQQACAEYARSLETAKVNYYTTKVQGCNKKQSFNFVDEMLNVKTTPILPKHESTEDLVEQFSAHFESRILILRRELSELRSNVTVDRAEKCRSSLTHFERVSMSTVQDIIMVSKPKSCQLDPIPTWLLKSCIDVLLCNVIYVL
ncbi:Hypothetical predicted protein [Paramuricea clavata]|uniref:Uncharacterized protein n=1 Tax=Paramuricea clavata TaxID=317549 RepID=A0A6S7HHV8_PARCT|nr:Hypothetical predicted protein [Paramuricea clavata]